MSEAVMWGGRLWPRLVARPRSSNPADCEKARSHALDFAVARGRVLPNGTRETLFLERARETGPFRCLLLLGGLLLLRSGLLPCRLLLRRGRSLRWLREGQDQRRDQLRLLDVGRVAGARYEVGLDARHVLPVAGDRRRGVVDLVLG